MFLFSSYYIFFFLRVFISVLVREFIFFVRAGKSQKIKIEGPDGIEPPTAGSAIPCSTAEL